MATIAQLNIRLGLLTQEFDRDLKKFERSIQTTASKLSSLGTTLSYSFTAPLGAIGVYAIKAAGDMEALRLALTSTMQGAGKSTADAAAELEALRKIALAPGIDFEQAVQGSIRLQSVGVSAADAREQLKQFANAVAAAGGTAENLNSVTVQFAQMIAKGKVFTQDLKIIKENLPSIGGAMQRAFGTQSAEDLQALGVSAQEFISKITTELAKAPRVAGGIKNSIVNAGVAIQQAAAKVGEALNNAFNVTGNLDAFATWINKMADWFAGLDDSTRKTVIGVGLFVAAIGPAIKVVSTLVSASTSVYGVFLRVSESFRLTTAAGTGTLGLFSRMTTAMKLNVFIVAAGAVLALAAAFKALNIGAQDASESQRIFAEQQALVTEQAGKETAALSRNFEVLKDGASSTDQRKKAISELLATYPQYLKGIDLEKLSLSQLNEVQASVTSEIVKSIAERQKAIAVDEQYAKVAQARLRITQLQQKGFAALTGEEVKRAGLSLFGTDFEKKFVSASAKAETVDKIIKLLEQDISNAGKTAKELADQFDKTFSSKTVNAEYDRRKAYLDSRDAIEEYTGAIQGNSDSKRAAAQFEEELDRRIKASAESSKDASKSATQSAKLYKDALASIAAVVQKGDVLGGEIIGEQAREIENQIERLIENGFKPYGKEIMNLKAMLQGLQLNQQISFTAPDKLPGLNIPVSVSSTELPPIGTAAIEKAKQAYASIGTTVENTNSKIRVAYEAFNADTITATELMQQLGEITRQQSASAYERISALAGGIESLGSAIASTIETGATSFASFAKSAVASIGEVISALLKQFIASLLAKTALAGPIGLALAGGVAAIGSALFKRVVGAQKFATGGVVRKPTLGLVGEYPGAATNPEIISPENKLRQIFRQEGSGGGELTAFVRGDDLLFILDKARARRGRRG